MLVCGVTQPIFPQTQRFNTRRISNSSCSIQQSTSGIIGGNDVDPTYSTSLLYLDFEDMKHLMMRFVISPMLEALALLKSQVLYERKSVLEAYVTDAATCQVR